MYTKRFLSILFILMISYHVLAQQKVQMINTKLKILNFASKPADCGVFHFVSVYKAIILGRDKSIVPDTVLLFISCVEAIKPSKNDIYFLEGVTSEEKCSCMIINFSGVNLKKDTQYKRTTALSLTPSF